MHDRRMTSQGGPRLTRPGRLRSGRAGHARDGEFRSTAIVIIFNPQSTGNAPESAEELRDELAARLPAVPLQLSPTQHAGHARDLARRGRRDRASAARLGERRRRLQRGRERRHGRRQRPGGLRRARARATPTTTAGHPRAAAGRRDRRRRRPPDRPAPADRRQRASAATVRYAHSYIGVGLTPVVAVDLEKGGKGSWREIASVVRGFSHFRPFPIRLEDGRRRRIDSLVFANIGEMAKYAKLSEAGAPDDGRFEVITQRQTGKLAVLATAIRAATRGLGPATQRHALRLHDARAHAAATGRRTRRAGRGHRGRRRHRTPRRSPTMLLTRRSPDRSAGWAAAVVPDRPAADRHPAATPPTVAARQVRTIDGCAPDCTI